MWVIYLTSTCIYVISIYCWFFSEENCVVGRGVWVEKPCFNSSVGGGGICGCHILPGSISVDSPSHLVVLSMCRVALGCWRHGGGDLIGSEWVGGCDFSVFQLLYYYIDRQLTFQVLLKKYVWKSKIVFVFLVGNINFIVHGLAHGFLLSMCFFANINYVWISSILLSPFLFIPPISVSTDIAIWIPWFIFNTIWILYLMKMKWYSYLFLFRQKCG